MIAASVKLCVTVTNIYLVKKGIYYESKSQEFIAGKR